MVNDDLRAELLQMRADDVRVRRELLESGELGGPYVPRMEAVHIRNAHRLRELTAVRGWPDEEIAGKGGAEAAWFIVEHAIGEPEFQRECLELLQACAGAHRVPRWHFAYLRDRIAMHEGRPQIYGTQWMDDPVDGRTRPWRLAEPDHVNELRSEVGLGPLHPVPEPGPELPLDEHRKIADVQQWVGALVHREDGAERRRDFCSTQRSVLIFRKMARGIFGYWRLYRVRFPDPNFLVAWACHFNETGVIGTSAA